MSTYEFDTGGVERLIGTLKVRGGATGDVPTQAADGTLDQGAQLGHTLSYLTVAAAAPTTYLTPIYYDSTAVTGGLYAWDGAAYQKIGNLVT